MAVANMFRAPDALSVGKAASAFRTDWLSLVPQDKTGDSFLDGGRHRSLARTTIVLKIAGGSDEEIAVPGVVATTAMEVKEMLAAFLMVQVHTLSICVKSGPYFKKVLDTQQVGTKAWIGGIKSFKPKKMNWPHPIGIIGCGYNGLKVAMTYELDENPNYVMFDRNDKVGGYCWITGANKTSRLQTEFGSFHIWWGQHTVNSGKVDYPNCNKNMNWMQTQKDAHDPAKDGWSMWPYKWEIQKHFHYGAEQFGLLPNIHFQTNVAKMDIIGDKNAEDRKYNLVVDNLKNKGKNFEVPVSVVFHFAGSLTRNRIIEYPGEDDFEGAIGYGMNDDTPYDKLANSTIAILGNGAFAVENARTALECGGNKAYIVTRRKNLASPRFPCWFVHQSPMPVPGWLVLNMFQKMYQAANFGDPWEYWSVHTNAARTNTSIIQNSRFGIGDVTFLMHIWGLLEYKVGTVKRMSKHKLHLSSGEVIEDVNIVLKALGLLGDYAVDKLHNMKELVGGFCSGDWRRYIQIDATGMNAANFATFSTGIGSTDAGVTYKFLYDYPKEFYKIESEGFMKQLPRHKEEPELEKPAYLTEVKFAMTAGVILDGMMPRVGCLKAWMGSYKHKMYHVAHNTDRTFEVAIYEWNKYQEEWKNRGIQHDYVPYPYNKDDIQEWFTAYSEHFKLPFTMSVNGPTTEQLEFFGGDVGQAENDKYK